VSTGPVTRVGLQLAGYTRPGVPDRDLFNGIVDTVLAAERSGFDSVWTMDHLHQISTVGEAEEPILEAYTTLAALAAVTSKVRLGTLVSACGFRNAALLAKIVTTIDVISQGRAILGIGAGWHEEEYRAYGFDFPSTRERLRQLENTVRTCRAMFTAAQGASPDGSFRGAVNIPPPVQLGGPPILIGGGGEKVLLPMVAKLADACNLFGGPATVLHKITVLTNACIAIGRDPGEITKTWLGTAILVENEWELQPKLERLGALFKLSPRAVRGFALCGTPNEIRRQVAAYRRVGIDGIILNVIDSADIRHIERVGLVVREAMES
jgi:alkanesulfonate monooxygenase SsuD/methylene tetrahydromethanopterin reductase-like flavin-dependent oxidoreductase (luciferase family)